MLLPNLIIAGPPKTGTTSLFDWLAKHPEVLPSSVKETYYFYEYAGVQIQRPNFQNNGWNGYEEFFRVWQDEPIRMEASPGYIYSKLAAEKLSSIPDLKIIIIYRKASDRLFSEYQFNRYKTKKIDGSFGDYLGYVNGSFTGEAFEQAILTPYVNRWLKHAKEDQFRILSFDEMKNNPLGLVKKVASYLRIDTSFFDEFQLEKKNETFGLRNTKFHQIALKARSITPPFIQKIITPIYYYFNKTGVPTIAPEEIELKRILDREIEKEELAFKTQFKRLFL